MDDADLAGLIARAQAGDDLALSELIARFETEIRAMVRGRLPRVLRRQYDSMDFVQAVLQSFWTDFEADSRRFSDPEHLRSFLAGVVRFKVLQEFRRRTRIQKFDVKRQEPLYVRRGNRDVPVEVHAPDPSPSQTAQAGDRLAQLVAGRPPGEAEVVTLRGRGLTYEEIAARTGMNERSARRVIDALRARMEDQEWQ